MTQGSSPIPNDLSRVHSARGDDDRGDERDVDSPLLSPLRELQLIDAHRAGDPEAMGTLLRSYQKRIFAVCYRMLRDFDVAQDLAQDAMLKVIEGIDSFDGRCRLSTWIIRVTMNACLSHLRKAKLRQHASIDSPVTGEGRSGTLGGQLPDLREPAASSRVEREEARDLVVRALGTLDPQMRAVLVLRDMHDLDYQIIAEVIEKPVGTVKSRLFRARAALREAVEHMQNPDRNAEGQPDDGQHGQ